MQKKRSTCFSTSAVIDPQDLAVRDHLFLETLMSAIGPSHVLGVGRGLQRRGKRNELARVERPFWTEPAPVSECPTQQPRACFNRGVIWASPAAVGPIAPRGTSSAPFFIKPLFINTLLILIIVPSSKIVHAGPTSPPERGTLGPLPGTNNRHRQIYGRMDT